MLKNGDGGDDNGEGDYGGDGFGCNGYVSDSHCGKIILVVFVLVMLVVTLTCVFPLGSRA